MNWVREHYFSELTTELSRVIDGRSSMALEIFDENGRLVTSNRPPAELRADSGAPARERKFPLLFFDPVLRATAGTNLPALYWTTHVQASQDASLLAAAIT